MADASPPFLSPPAKSPSAARPASAKSSSPQPPSSSSKPRSADGSPSLPPARRPGPDRTRSAQSTTVPLTRATTRGSARATVAAARDADSGNGGGNSGGSGGGGKGDYAVPRDPAAEAARTDARWARMQATLAEVEGAGAAQAARLFGAAHADALGRLREAQIGLAQAWARGEGADEAGAGGSGGGGGGADAAGVVRGESKAGSTGAAAGGDSASEGRSPGASLHEAGPGASAGARGPGGEADAEEDVFLAKRRREANDRYFARVSRGVLDVVGRLEEVAAAMGEVEHKSREVWSESESMNTESMTS